MSISNELPKPQKKLYCVKVGSIYKDNNNEIDESINWSSKKVIATDVIEAIKKTKLYSDKECYEFIQEVTYISNIDKF